MSGYRGRFIVELQSRHKCTLCTLAMRNPVQTECGHLFCKLCLEPILLQPNPRCPVDQESISRNETFPDNACKREILTLQVHCDNYASGCEWIGQLKRLEVHLEVCEYRQIKCSQCGQYIRLVKYEAHVSTECLMRPSNCPHCGSSVPHDRLEIHIKSSCPSALHLCPNKCNLERKYRLTELKKHLEVKGGDCPLQEIPCPYYDLGCVFKSLRKEMDGHFEKRKVFHAQLSVGVLVEVKAMIPELAKNIKSVKLALEDVECKVTSVDRVSDIDERFKQLEIKQDISRERLRTNLKDEILKVQLETETLQRQFKSSPSPGQLAPLPYHSPFSDPVPSAYNSTNSQKVDHLFAKFNELDHTLNTCLNHNIDCDVRIQLLERATYDGTFLWKIDNYAQRRREAINGATLSLYSSPFYTSRQGYKMCARVYLNGDGSGKNTHLSFFFCVMRGPNDALLPWPFQQKVTLLLLNQNGHKNVIDQFRPDTQSSSFQRPVHREMNIASGCPTFCPLSELHNGFVKEDCIFLGVIVDTAGIPKPVSL